MENASKALVIAGAILISILIIGLGVFIYNGAAGTVKKANLNSQEAQAQNSQFEAYFGDHVSATEVKQLLSLIRSNNITSKANDEDKMVFVNGKYDTTFAVKTGDYYEVRVANEKAVAPSTEGDTEAGSEAPSAEGYYQNGYIRNISIQNLKDKKTTGGSGDSGDSTT